MAKIAGIYGIMGAADCVSQCNRKLAQKVENEMEAVRAHPQRRQEEVVQRLLQGRRQGDQAADRVSCRRAPQLALSPAPIWHDSGRRRCAAAGGHTPRAPRARTQGSRYTSRRPSSRPRARVHGTEMRSPFTAVADASAVLRLAVPARRTSLRSTEKVARGREARGSRRAPRRQPERGSGSGRALAHVAPGDTPDSEGRRHPL